ncbi:MAG: bifunctional heptose 7-phosphate kinase/heptose 1-phosphate adenyltransferase [Bacteroidia bacterium]
MATNPSIEEVFEKISKVIALVVGDVMLDAYFWGKVDRISPEAPVPIVLVEKKENRLGGAANVALNIKALEATAIICSVVGEDEKGKLFCELIEKEGMDSIGIIKSKTRKTTVKTRVIGNNHQMLRVDQEMLDELSNEDEQKLFERISEITNKLKIDVIIFEDYDKGVFTSTLINKIIELANQKNIATAVDPKKKHFADYKNVTLFKPNLKELREGLKVDFENNDLESIKKAVMELKERQNADMILTTLSEQGILIMGNNVEAIVPAHVRNISDVSGAGDTVISVAALALAAGLEPVAMAHLANLAGGLVCEEVGVVPVNKTRLMEEASQMNLFINKGN